MPSFEDSKNKIFTFSYGEFQASTRWTSNQHSVERLMIEGNNRTLPNANFFTACSTLLPLKHPEIEYIRSFI
jgi:hypothetical protein